MGWIADLWNLIQTAATMTKEVERANSELKDVRKDLNQLTVAVSRLNDRLEHDQSNTSLMLDQHKGNAENERVRLAAMLDVFTTRVDAKIAEFEHRIQSVPTPGKSPGKSRQALKDRNNS